MKSHRECTDDACFMYVEEPRDTYGPHWVGYCADRKRWREYHEAKQAARLAVGESLLRQLRRIPIIDRMVQRDTPRTALD